MVKTFTFPEEDECVSPKKENSEYDKLYNASINF